MITLFAGRPAAGKSTGARWFAAQFTRGTLGGCWQGRPQTIAYIGGEETARFVVKPGLQAAGADMRRVLFPEVAIRDEAVNLTADVDEKALTRLLLEHGVTVVVVDPIMSTIRRKVDIYRTNEMREALGPWMRIAQAINGVVLGITHLKKGTTADVVAAINASSAIGEVARCVFGFAVDRESGTRVMGQAKNSCGPEDLSLTYSMIAEDFTADTGRTGSVVRFELGGESEITVSDILASDGHRDRQSARTQKVVDFVNGRDATAAEDVVRACLANSANHASQVLRRLYTAGRIDNPVRGLYTPRMQPPK